MYFAAPGEGSAKALLEQGPASERKHHRSKSPPQLHHSLQRRQEAPKSRRKQEAWDNDAAQGDDGIHDHAGIGAVPTEASSRWHDAPALAPSAATHAPCSSASLPTLLRDPTGAAALDELATSSPAQAREELGQV